MAWRLEPRFAKDNTMKRKTSFLWLLLIAVTSANAAQLYRWVDNKGNVEWRDTPPPASVPAKNVQQRKIGDNVISGESSFSLDLATKNHPVTFWSSSDCGNICDSARAHLARRGVPYADKNPQSDPAGFKKVSPANEVPMLQVGAITVKGYLDSEWDNTLDSAGYPRTAVARPKPPAPASVPKPAAEGTPAPAAK
jgi:hypothetical protein